MDKLLYLRKSSSIKQTESIPSFENYHIITYKYFSKLSMNSDLPMESNCPKDFQNHFLKKKREKKSMFVNLSITTINLGTTMKKKLIWMNFALSIVKLNMNYY